MKYILALFFFFGLMTEVTAEVDLTTILPEHIPSHVQSIENENTGVQLNRDLLEVTSDELTEDLLAKSEFEITNPHLIEQLNATDVNRSFFTFGYSSEVYLGRWPLSYQSKETSVNWAYQKINDNFITAGQPIYSQKEERKISGGLQSKVIKSDQVQNMVLLNTKERVHWPIDFQSVYGANTKKQIALTNDSGASQLEAYAPAIKETGTITFGDVYLTMTGRKQHLKIKNVVEEELISWLPIQDHLAFHMK